MNAPQSPPVEPHPPAPAGDLQCFHCGQPVPPDVHFSLRIDHAERRMCCAGCQAVAEAIVASGLDTYYRNREAFPASPADAAQALEDLQLYDHASVQAAFVREVGPGEREASLILEGIACAACVWLNERHLAQLPGVTGVAINYATRRARVRWIDRELKLSQILESIAAIGYQAHPYDPARHEAIARKEQREALWRLFVAGFGAMQVMMYAFPAYIAAEGEMTRDIEQLMRWASLVLTLPVVFYSSLPFIRNAVRDLRLRRAGMDVPVAIGVVVAFVASVWATVTASGEVYFDSISMFVFLLLGGRYLEMKARQRATAIGESLARQLPAIANRLPDYPASMADERVAAAELRPEDTVLVRPGEVVPADGRVLSGESALDESLLTGESRPVRRLAGDLVIGGATNGEGSLVVRVTAAGEASRLASILRLMERAALERPRLAEVADRVAGHFVVWILLISLAVAAVWWSIDPARALWITVAVLVVTCPCALSLATPTALVVAHGRLARTGLLATRGHVVETLARVSHVVFDKTGTLTEGRLGLERIVPQRELAADECLRLAAALESVSEHPMARILRASAGADLPTLERFRVFAGRGVDGVVGGRLLRIGRPDFVAEIQSAPSALPTPSGGGSLVYLGDETGWLAVFVLSDVLRQDAASTVAALQGAGLQVSVLSGDAPDAVAAMAAQAGVADWRGGCLPEEKLHYVKELQAAGAVVAVVGDGINDGPVLAAAQLSIAMSGGADLAKIQADCVLLGDRLGALVDGSAVARKTLRVIRENLAWAVAYNLIAIPLAALGWVTPWLAGVGMAASSLVVVVNALRLR